VAKKSTSGTKSASIRNYKSQNPTAKPKEIAEALSKAGEKVTPAFVSTVLSNDKRRGKKRKGGRRKGGRPAGAGGMRGFENLVQAKRLADQMGGVAKAKAALDALAKILG
jgi:hypothetical protein